MEKNQKQSKGQAVLKYKLVFVGDQSVGKTSIITRFMSDTFTGLDQPTVGIDFVSKTLQFNNKTIRLQLWDTAGQERFRSLIPSYVRDSNAVLIVYDVTQQSSFESLQKWFDYVKEERGDDVIVYLVANKIDATEERQVSLEEGQKKSQEFGVKFYEASAKTGENVQNLFKTLTQNLLEKGEVDQPSLEINNLNKQNSEQKELNPHQQTNQSAGVSLTANNAYGQQNANKQGKCC